MSDDAHLELLRHEHIRREMEAAEEALAEHVAGMVRFVERNGKTGHQLAGLLAIIHRDGGHHQAQHGTQQAVLDAVDRVLAERDREPGEASWPQGGHWTREPAEQPGWYPLWSSTIGNVSGVKFLLAGCALPGVRYRWSTPLPPMPPVTEDEAKPSTDDTWTRQRLTTLLEGD